MLSNDSQWASADLLRQLYSEDLAADTWGPNNVGELEMASHSGNGIDEDWVMFLKESGL